MNKLSRVGINLAKNVFQLHGVDRHGKAIWHQRLARNNWLKVLIKAAGSDCEIGMEACAGAHHWARQLQVQGFTVKLIAPQFVKPYVKSNPLSGNLDRIQIVKGWLDVNGEMQEKIYDVVWSGDRKPGVDGKVPMVGSTVDVEKTTWTNTIGATELITVWQDPDFDPALKAFYYARVIEIPTPRWTAFDAAYFEEAEFGPEVPMTVTERAYTSPIWYGPTS